MKMSQFEVIILVRIMKLINSPAREISSFAKMFPPSFKNANKAMTSFLHRYRGALNIRPVGKIV
jgi:hypothetical protein